MKIYLELQTKHSLYHAESKLKVFSIVAVEPIRRLESHLSITSSREKHISKLVKTNSHYPVMLNFPDSIKVQR